MSKILFVVQGEGRGHLTQALAMQQMLERNGHTVVAALVGLGKGRSIPRFFAEQFTGNVESFEVPTLIYGNSKSVSMLKTSLKPFLQLPAICRGMAFLKHQIGIHTPDLIVNFYEATLGMFYGLNLLKIPYVAVGHQYLLAHKDFESYPNNPFQQHLLEVNTQVTCFKVHKKLALSFDEIGNDTQRKVFGVPPLIRKEVLNLAPTTGDFLLVYITHHKLAEEIETWHKKYPEVRLEVFWNNAKHEEEYSPWPNLTFHQVDAEKYLHMMAKCKGLASTAGFESICEAMYLGKPVMMVPVPNHIEQAINAHDAQRAGAGIAANTFDISLLIDFIPKYVSKREAMKQWIGKSEGLFLQHLGLARA